MNRLAGASAGAALVLILVVALVAGATANAQTPASDEMLQDIENRVEFLTGVVEDQNLWVREVAQAFYYAFFRFFLVGVFLFALDRVLPRPR